MNEWTTPKTGHANKSTHTCHFVVWWNPVVVLIAKIWTECQSEHEKTNRKTNKIWLSRHMKNYICQTTRPPPVVSKLRSHWNARCLCWLMVFQPQIRRFQTNVTGRKLETGATCDEQHLLVFSGGGEEEPHGIRRKTSSLVQVPPTHSGPIDSRLTSWPSIWHLRIYMSVGSLEKNLFHNLSPLSTHRGDKAKG